MKNKFLLILTTTLLPFGIIWQLFAHQREQINPDIVFKRKIHEVTDRITDQIQLPDGSSPNSFELQNDNYFVYSIENKNFICINKQKKIKIYPNEEDSPDNLKLVLAFKADSNKILALDQVKKKLVNINIKTGVFIYTDLPIFSRGIPINDTVSLLATVDSITKDIVFFKYNILTHEKKNVKVPLAIVKDYGLANDGFFVCDNDGEHLLYVLYHLGKVIKFDKQFEKIETYSTLDNYRFNPLVVKKGSKFYLSGKSTLININATLNEKFIFVVSRIRSVDDKNNKVKGEVIDIYDAISPNQYRYSIHINNNKVRQILDIKCRENCIYVMTINDSFKNEILKIDLSNPL
jgi:hypothetical protein